MNVSPRVRMLGRGSTRKPVAIMTEVPPPAVPVWLKLGYGLGVPVIAVVYRRHYGAQNFLWLSDIALGSTASAVILESPLLASLPAIGVLPLELAWTLDFIAGGRLLGLAGYMFDKQLPLGLRLLSLFHLALPPTLLWMLDRFGYDRRALPVQVALTSAALPLTYWLTEPKHNINWVFGPGEKPQRKLPPLVYLGLEMLAIPVLVNLPMHALMRRLFPLPQERAPKSTRFDQLLGASSRRSS